MIKSKSICAVYHWWGENFPPYANLRAPILPSIATLRAVSNIPIVVLNCSEKYDQQSWGRFPETLDFQVINIVAGLKKYQHLVPGWLHLSRLFDLQTHITNKTVMYVDSDVFWFRNPVPLLEDSNRMCINPNNSGFFYYNDQTREVNEFFDIFKSHAISAIHSMAIRELFKKYISWDAWYGVWDEMILKFMHNQNPNIINVLSTNEHAITSQIIMADPNKVNMLHANGMSVGNKYPKNEGEAFHSRGLLGIAVKEFYEKIQSVLSEEDIKLIYTQDQLNEYVPLQFELLNNLHRIEASKNENGHFDFSKCVTPDKLRFI